MKKLTILIIAIVLAVVVCLILYELPQTREQMIGVFSTIGFTAGGWINSITSNPSWVQYIAPYWSYIACIIGIPIGVILTKVIYIDWYAKGGSKAARSIIGLGNTQREPQAPEASPPPQPANVAPPEQKK